MQIVDLGEPCHNFQFTECVAFRDPRDGREKIATASDVTGAGVGLAIIIDPDTGRGENYTFPGDNGAFAVFNLRNEALLFGTNCRKAYILRLNLKDRVWAEPLRDKDQTYIWNFCMGSDGMVYAGAYPGCPLLRYDPERHTLENLGRASDNRDNLYSIHVRTLPNHILIACGTATDHFAVWDIANARMRALGRSKLGPGGLRATADIANDYLCLRRGGEMEFYDPRTLAPIAQPANFAPADPVDPLAARLSDGRQLVIRGQEYFIRHDGHPDSPFREIPAPRPATGIMTIISDPDGNIWGSSAFGQTIFRYEPTTGAHWNSGAVCARGGEVYGMAFCHDRLFLAAYSGGDLVVYDPAKPWDQRGNVNPRTIGDLGGKLVRPAAKSVVGPDGAIWSGWYAKYGVYGGGLSRVDPASLEIKSWYDPIPEQSVLCLTADERWLYFATSGWACGLPAKVEPFYFVVWDPQGKIVWKKQYAAGVRLTSVAAAFGTVLVGVGNEIHIFDPESRRFTGAVKVGVHCYCLLPFGEGHFVAFCGKELLLVNPKTATTTKLCDLPGEDLTTATVTPRGELYFAAGSHLYKVVKN
ncbi:MAG: hypothetical protein KJ964_03385 [Verrucomicrobia bacterium]|nr:hypothetical protein [Verrucomicrobiota bacterium]MBU1734341.1 hypothetical protein [Verrucomicrobiota bacterium]MBU1857973.1 hypothetical protein [Verrucomicrobiota bacterium]